jgi:outer membrane protein insertion porin family
MVSSLDWTAAWHNLRMYITKVFRLQSDWGGRMRKVGLLICLFVSLGTGAWAQEQTPRVAVMPFVIQGPKDLPNVRKTLQEVLTRQLSELGLRTVDPAAVPGEAVRTEEQARSAARKANADYALFGSLNQVGATISIDAKLVHALAQKRTEVLFGEERGLENLALAADRVSKDVAALLMEKAIIADIQVRGNERIEAAAIKLSVKSKVGEILSPEQIREDIRSIYNMGYFQNVDAQVTDLPKGKLLTFVVQENPTVQEVNIQGDKRIKEKDILAAIATKPFTVLDRAAISEDVQKILKLYQQKGYFNAQVTSDISFPQDPRKAVVTFNIKEQGRVNIEEISFTGNQQFSDRKLRGVMQTKEKSIFLSWFTDRGVLQRDILDTDVDRLTVYYHDRGFMDARVGTPQISHREDGIYIEIPVQEGERYRVESVSLTGDMLEESEKIREDLKVEAGDYFSREKLREDVQNISKRYMDQGYAYAEVNPDVQQKPAQHTAAVTYQISQGRKVRIGNITISGNTKTRDKVIRREIDLSEGDTFNASKLEKSMLDLRKLDFFENVEIVPSEGAQPEVMDLDVKIREKFTGSVSVGGGYSSDDGLFVTGEVVQRNLFGRGQYLGLKGYLGQEAQRYVLSFTEPWLFDKPISAGFDVYDWVREYPDFTQDAAGIRLRSGYGFGNWSRISGFYTFENAEMTDISENASSIIRDQEGEQIKSSITTVLERDSTDHPFLPTRGSLNVISVEYSTPYLGSDSNFVKTDLRSGWYIPLYWRLVGFVRGEVGWIVEDDDKPAPLYERFFLGGINSLRAFDWGDVGPTDEQGEVIGGTTYGLANFEVLFPLLEKMGLRGVVFFDAGNSFLGSNPFQISDYRTDAGAGIRWNSPLGPLRIEWAYNLDRREGEDSNKFQFSAGAFF